MKIAVIINSLSGGGAERFVAYLVPYLEKIDVDVQLILLNDNRRYKLDTRDDVIILDNCNENQSEFLKLIKLPILAFRLNKIIKEKKIDFCVSFLTRSSFLLALTKIISVQNRIIISERSYSSEQYGYFNLKSFINKILIRVLYPKANKIITNSIGNANDLIKNFNIKYTKIATVYNPLCIEKVDSYQGIDGFFDKRFFNIISVGRIDEGKNHKLIINAIKLIPNLNIRVYIFGEGKLRKELDTLIKQNNLTSRVFLCDFQENIFEYLKSSDLFLFSSNHEGFPNVLLEAMACGLPIVTTNCPSGPNELLESEFDYSYEKMIQTKYGILVPRHSETIMAQALETMVFNREYYLNCKQFVKIRSLDFDKEVILKQFYDEIITT